MSLNNNEKKKIDSIIVRIGLILLLGFFALEAWRNVADIAGSETGLERQNQEAQQRADELERSLEELRKYENR
jgi:hypothetical protein